MRGGLLLRILSADGMTVFSTKGRLMETGFIFDASHAREVVTGGGRTTAASAASFFGKVVKVSQDGPIELWGSRFCRTKRWPHVYWARPCIINEHHLNPSTNLATKPSHNQHDINIFTIGTPNAV